MKTRVGMIVVACVLVWGSWIQAEEIEGLPLHVDELNDGVIRLWVGDVISSTAITAIATEQGIVVIDTVGIPKIDEELRRVIARELDSSDFAYLINTHEHGDHTGGNAVYDDCTIVGHELVAPGMEAIAERSDRHLEWFARRILELEKEMQSLPTDDPSAAGVREELIFNRLNMEVAKRGEIPPPPELTFSDRMTLDLGDTTFDLSYIGGMHTASDIAVFVPEHRLLFTGDTMADVWLTDSPGCLAAFMIRHGIPHDFPRFLANWDRLLARREQIESVLPGHWNGELSVTGAEARVEYVRALWDGVNRAAAEGETIEDVQTEYRLDTRFPDLVGSPGFNPQLNYQSIAELWRTVSSQASAAKTIYDLLVDGAGDEAVLAVIAERNSAEPEYFFLETEFNAYGYALLQQQKIDEAVAIFEVNVDLYPESWNVYDSLAEALLRAGETHRAKAMYEKSLVLNPENTNGREVLTKLQEDEGTM